MVRPISRRQKPIVDPVRLERPQPPPPVRESAPLRAEAIDHCVPAGAAKSNPFLDRYAVPERLLEVEVKQPEVAKPEVAKAELAKPELSKPELAKTDPPPTPKARAPRGIEPHRAPTVAQPSSPPPRIAPEPGALAKIGNLGNMGLGLGAACAGLKDYLDGKADYDAGRTREGVVKMMEGAATAFGGASLFAGAPPQVTGIAFGLASGIAGTRDLVEGVEQDDDEKIALGAVKLAGGAALVSGNSIAQGVGAALALGASAYEHREELMEGAKTVAGWVEAAVALE